VEDPSNAVNAADCDTCPVPPDAIAIGVVALSDVNAPVEGVIAPIADPLIVLPVIIAPEIVPPLMEIFGALSVPVTVIVGTVNGPVNVPPVSARTFAKAAFNCAAVRI